MGNYNNNNGNYGNRNYGNNGNYNGNYNNGNNGNNNQPKPKRSGATYTTLSKGKYAGTGLPTVHAWRLTKYGMMTAKAHPYGDKSKVHVGEQKGKKYFTYTVEVSNASMGTSQVYYTTMCIDTKRIGIDELGLVISPNGSGRTRTGKHVKGYFGRSGNNK